MEALEGDSVREAYRPLYDEMLASPEAVQERVDEIAAEVIEKYRGVHPLFVCLMRGGVPFASALMTSIARQDPYFHPEMDYITISAYGDKQTASKPKLVMGLAPNTMVEGRTVVTVDDMLDTGVTTVFAREYFLHEKGAQSVDTIVLVQRKRKDETDQSATIYGFEIANDKWLVGSGLDDRRICREANRWMGGIAIAANIVESAEA